MERRNLILLTADEECNGKITIWQREEKNTTDLILVNQEI